MQDKLFRKPFAKNGTVYGFDMAVLDRAFQLVTLTETGRAHRKVILRRFPTGDTSLGIDWKELRHDKRPGRELSVIIMLETSAYRAGKSVYIAACYAHGSAKKAGFARQTLNFAAALGASLNAPIEIQAVGEGAAVWLALEGQPDSSNLRSVLGKLRRRKAPAELIERVRSRDFVGLRRADPLAFSYVVKLLDPWDGGWSRGRVRQIAANANEGLR